MGPGILERLCRMCLFMWDNVLLIPIFAVLQVYLEGVSNGEIIEAPKRGGWHSETSSYGEKTRRCLKDRSS
jgi:hypothetical protein